MKNEKRTIEVIKTIGGLLIIGAFLFFIIWLLTLKLMFLQLSAASVVLVVFIKIVISAHEIVEQKKGNYKFTDKMSELLKKAEEQHKNK